MSVFSNGFKIRLRVLAERDTLLGPLLEGAVPEG